MDNFTLLILAEEGVGEWLGRFKNWFHLTEKNDGKADWCQLVMGKEVQSTLQLVADGAKYDELKKTLLDELGERKPQEAALRRLATLQKGDVPCRELVMASLTLGTGGLRWSSENNPGSTSFRSLFMGPPCPVAA